MIMGTIIGEKRILKSTLEPPNRNWLWLKTVDGTPVLHEYINGYWTPFATAKTNNTTPVDTTSFGEVDYDPITRRINFYSSNDKDHVKVLGYIDTIPFESTVDTKIRQAIASLQNAIDAITSGDTTTAIKTFQEVIDFLDGVTDDATLIGKLNELRTLINAKYSKPASGIPASDLADGVIPDVSGFATKTEVNAKANSADVYTKTEVDDKVANAGKVKTVSVNGGTPSQPDAQGNVNVSVAAGSRGDDGITPHIDALTGNWFIGDTDTQVKAQGPKGDSGVASGDGIVVVNDTSGEPAEIAEGHVAVLGAGVGKYIADRAIPTSGTFADAYDKAKANSSVVFPWMLIDEDESGEPVKKMMWHVGNRDFIDAIGGKVDGVKNGVTVVSTEAGYMRLWTINMYQQNYIDFPISAGENNFSFEELGRTSCYSIEFINTDKNGLLLTKITHVDLGGLTIKFSDYNDSKVAHGGITWYNSPFRGYSSIKTIKRMVLDATQASPSTGGWFSDCSSLENLEMSGIWKQNSKGDRPITNFIQNVSKLRRCDFSGLSVSANGYYDWFAGASKLEYLDIRGFDFSNATNIARFVRGAALKTIIVGNIDTTKVTNSSGFMDGVTGATLVCTQDTPPAWNIDFINGHISSIKVPNKNIDVEGTETAVIDLYKAANGWSTYADIMSTYEEGEY